MPRDFVIGPLHLFRIADAVFVLVRHADEKPKLLELLQAQRRKARVPVLVDAPIQIVFDDYAGMLEAGA